VKIFFDTNVPLPRHWQDATRARLRPSLRPMISLMMPAPTPPLILPLVITQLTEFTGQKDEKHE
jgi:hypothetical protein